jgi:LysM repeat protein
MKLSVFSASWGLCAIHLGGAKMASSRRNLKFLTLALVLILLLSACFRPLGQSDEEEAELATQVAAVEATAQVEEESQAEEEAESGLQEEEEVAQSEPSTDVPDEDESEKEDVEETADSDEEEISEPESVESADSDEVATKETTETDVETEDEVESEEEVGSEEQASTDDEASASAEDSPDIEEAEEPVIGEAVAEELTATTIPATHTVASGENLFRIGLKYGMSWVPLATYNNLPNANRIYVGQMLHIPGGQPIPMQGSPESASYSNYVVKAGDNLFRISRAFGLSPDEIAEANGIVDPSRIYAGQVLKIPTGS